MRFLIVDDSAEWLKYHYQNIHALLPDAEFDIAQTAAKAFEKVTMHTPNHYNVILVDMQMEPVRDEEFAGVWLIKKIRESRKCYLTKIIIISAINNIDEIAKNLNTSYISKASLNASPVAFKMKLKELLKF